jgi:hypothetical protein
MPRAHPQCRELRGGSSSYPPSTSRLSDSRTVPSPGRRNGSRRAARPTPQTRVLLPALRHGALFSCALCSESERSRRRMARPGLITGVDRLSGRPPPDAPTAASQELFALAFPLGWIASPDHELLLAVVGHPVAFVFLLGMFVVLLVHSAHRFHTRCTTGSSSSGSGWWRCSATERLWSARSPRSLSSGPRPEQGSAHPSWRPCKPVPRVRLHCQRSPVGRWRRADRAA